MRVPVPRFVRWAVALAVIAALSIAVFQYWGTSQIGTANASTAADETYTPTKWGPLGPADRDLLVMVRQAGLCGEATGLRAQHQSGSPQVRTVAQRIGSGYGDLDRQVRTVAAKLGVPLPDQPSTEQQGWMHELAGRSGSQFDRMFAQRLRYTDGEVLPAITGVRAGTRNELIRSFAASAAEQINQHMESLESTGLVDYSRLPEPPAAAPAAATVPAGAGAGAQEQFNPVARATLVPPAEPPAGHDATAVVAALISIGALLVALGLVGATGRRGRRTGGATQRHSAAQRPAYGRRHAAHRW
ncbi:MAG TPA: DUF4142 domain-containing protein [Pseudonocardiaceae bacterium]